MENHGFNQVHHYDENDQADNSADMVMLVWHENQILPAEQYRKAHWPDKTVDIAICQDPNIQKAQLGEKAIIYNF